MIMNISSLRWWSKYFSNLSYEKLAVQIKNWYQIKTKGSILQLILNFVQIKTLKDK